MKRLSKVIMILLLAVSVCMPLMAVSQKSYASTDLVIDLMRYLYVAEGKALPSTSGPWTHDELIFMLSRFNRNELSEESGYLYDAIDRYLHSFAPALAEENLEFDIELYSRVRGFVHSNPKDFYHVDQWGVPGYRIPAPVLSAELSVGLYDKFFLFMDPSIGLVRNVNKEKMQSAYAFSNMILLPPATTLDTSANTPMRAYTSFGDHGWNILLGRERVEWGPGHTGNFIFGDQIPYHDMLRINAYTKNFKYTFITSFMIHPQNYFVPTSSDPDVDKNSIHTNYGYTPNFGQSSWMNGTNMYMHHRFEWRICEKVGLAVTEGILYQHPDNYLDLRVLNPMMIFHNLYMKQYANSLLNIDLDWTIVPGVNWYTSLVVDDIALPFIENNADVPGSASPNSIGVLTGLNLAFPQKKGFWAGNVEFAYTDPYLYLRDLGVAKAEEGQRDYRYGLSFITGIREYASEDTSRYDLAWIGYKHGGDAIVTSADVQWSSYDGWGAGGRVFYMAHGVNDILSRWQPVETLGGFGEMAPSTGNGDPDDYFPVYDKDKKEFVSNEYTKDSIMHTLVIGFNGYYSLQNDVIFSGALDLVTIWNPGNLKANPTSFDCQLTLGMTFSF